MKIRTEVAVLSIPAPLREVAPDLAKEKKSCP